MRRIFRPSEVTQSLLRPWREQAGEALTALLILSGVVSAILAGFGAGATLLTLEDRRELSSCLQKVNALTQNLQLKYGATGIVPLDDPNVTEIRNCKTYVDQLVKQPHLGNSAAIHTLQTNVNGTLSGLTACRIIAVAPNPPLAGDRSFYVSANIPLNGVTASGTISLTVAGTQLSAPATPDGYLWDGFVDVPVAVSRQAAGTVSPVSVTARSDVGRLPSGACPSGADASTPGKCFVGCTTPTVNVVWKDPPIPEIKLFLAAPSTVVKGEPTPIGLTWIVKNADSVSIDQGVGEVDKIGSTLEFPPDQDTTYTLTAVGVRPVDTKTATQKVTVKEVGTVVVTVRNGNTSQPVGGASVTRPGGPTQTTNNSGQTTFTGVPAGASITFTATANGFGTGSASVTPVASATTPLTITLPVIVSCSPFSHSGGDVGDTQIVEMGKTPASFTFFWDTQTVKDRIVVTHDGTTLFDTGCVGASASQNLSYSGGSTQVRVQVQPNCAGGTGTGWSYTVHCPVP